MTTVAKDHSWRAWRKLSWLGAALVVAVVGAGDVAADVSVPRSSRAAGGSAPDGVDDCAGRDAAKRAACAGNAKVGAARPSAAPVCGKQFTPGRSVAAVSASDVQEALLGASASGATLLFLRGPWQQCVEADNGAALLLADRADASGASFDIVDVSALPAFARFARTEATMTVSPDGNGVIGSGARFDSFLVSTRSGRGQRDFDTPVAGPFVALNASLPRRA